MLKWRNVILCGILSALLICLVACQATVSGSKGGDRYELKRSKMMPNYWEVNVNKDVKPAYNAVLAGLKDLGLRISISKVDRLSGIVEGSFADGKKFKITLAFESQGVTLMRIKAGLTGSKTLSVSLFQSIEKYFFK